MEASHAGKEGKNIYFRSFFISFLTWRWEENLHHSLSPVVMYPKPMQEKISTLT
jgi:hypothetical protein